MDSKIQIIELNSFCLSCPFRIPLDEREICSIVIDCENSNVFRSSLDASFDIY